MPVFLVRIVADAQRPTTLPDLQELREALVDFQAVTGSDPTNGRWTVSVLVSAMTIEGAAAFGVELVVEAANAVGMPPSDIAALEAITSDEQYRRNVGTPAPRQ